MGASAAGLEVPLVRGQVARASTDAVVPNKAGYRTALMVSFDKDKVLSNYHQPTDIADNLDFATVANCARVTDSVIRKLAGSAALSSSSLSTDFSISLKLLPRSPSSTFMRRANLSRTYSMYSPS